MQEQQPIDLGKTQSGIQPNIAGLLCYLIGLIVPVFFLVTEKENKFVRFHAWQSLFLIIPWIVVYVVLSIIGILPLTLLADLAIFGVAIYCMYQAYQGKEFRLPIIGDLAAQRP